MYTREGKICVVFMTFLCGFIVLRSMFDRFPSFYERHGANLKHHVDSYANSVIAHPYVEHAVGMISSSSSDGQQRAEHYFHEQRYRILKSAKYFQWREYYSTLLLPAFESGEIDGDSTFYTIERARVNGMRRRYTREGRDDYLISMDKCKMKAFLKRHALPTLNVLYTWGESVEDTMSALNDDNTVWKSDIVASYVSTTGLVLKCCHLPDDVRYVEETPDRTSIVEWVVERFEKRYRDIKRPWDSDLNGLRKNIRPGIYLAVAPPATAARFSVEVVWGYAYVASESFERDNGVPVSAVYMRDPAHVDSSDVDDAWTPRVHTYEGSYAATTRTPTSETIPVERRWLGKAHMDCVWILAQRVAKIVGNENIRVDILSYVDGRCFVEDLSLTREPFLGLHYRYLSKLWIEPLETSAYDVLSETAPTNERKTAPLYDQ